jgi:integrase
VRLIANSLADKSWSGYGSHWRKFELFCAEADLDPMTCTEFDIACYIGWIGDGGQIMAKTMQPYLSAINKVYSLVYADEDRRPAVGPLVTSVKRGLERAQAAVPTQRAVERAYLPTDATYAILEYGERLLGAPEVDTHALRQVAAVLLGTMTATRADSLLEIQLNHVVFLDDTIIVEIVKQKGKDTEPVRTLSYERKGCPRVWSLLGRFKQLQESAGSSRRRFLCLRGEVWPTKSSKADRATHWIREILTAVQWDVPEYEYYSAHSLRKGAATGMFACGVPIQRIRFLGGWARGSATVEEYIDLMAPRKPSTTFFFGSLTPA